MADEGDVLKNLDTAAAPNGSDTAPVAGIISQYVKDLSVENPNAPASYRWQDQPKMDVQFNIGAKPASDDVTEVELKVTVTAKMEQGTAYIVDDQTVAKTNGSSTRSAAGTIVDVDAQGVWVRVGI